MEHFKVPLNDTEYIQCLIYDTWIEAYFGCNDKIGYPAMVESCPVDHLDKLIETLQEAKRIISVARTP